MRVALTQAGELGRVEARVHAGQDREATGRWHGELALVAELAGITLVGLEDLGKDRHVFLRLVNCGAAWLVQPPLTRAAT